MLAYYVHCDVSSFPWCVHADWCPAGRMEDRAIPCARICLYYSRLLAQTGICVVSQSPPWPHLPLLQQRDGSYRHLNGKSIASSARICLYYSHALAQTGIFVVSQSPPVPHLPLLQPRAGLDRHLRGKSIAFCILICLYCCRMLVNFRPISIKLTSTRL